TAGMIWSVSTFDRRSGTPTPVCLLNGSMPASRASQIFRRRQRAAHRGCRGDQRRHQVGAAALALPAFEVAVRSRRAALPRLELVGVHAQTHRATRRAPLGARLGENLVQALLL